MSLFWPLSPRTCGGSHRWSLGHHPPGPCASRSVAVALKASGSADQRRPFSTRCPKNHRPTPTFATKSALSGPSCHREECLLLKEKQTSSFHNIGSANVRCLRKAPRLD